MPLSCDQSLELLRSAARKGRLSHAHILTGAVEEILNKILYPLMRDLLGAEAEGHADVHVVQPKSKSRQIVVEDVDELIAKLNQTTFYSGGYRFALVLQAERMNTVTANKFLKTLEEPFPRTHIFLVTEQPSYLLATVRSRCGILSVKSSPPMPDEALTPLLEVFGKEGLKDPLDALLWARDLEQYFFDIKKDCEDEMKKRMKDALKLLEGPARDEKEEELKAQASALYNERRAVAFSQLIQAAGSGRADVVLLLEEAHSQMQRNLQDAIVLENLVLKISDVMKRESLAVR